MAVNLSHVYASITSPYQKNPFSYGDYKLSLSSYVVEFTTATGAHERRNDANVGFSRSDRARNPSASPLCAGAHAERRSRRRPRAGNPAARGRKGAFVARGHRSSGLALHDHAQSVRQHSPAGDP